jgi:hypothetical protein
MGKLTAEAVGVCRNKRGQIFWFQCFVAFERECAGLAGSVVPPPLYYTLRFVAQQQKAATKESKAVSFVNISDCVRAGQMSAGATLLKNVPIQNLYSSASYTPTMLSIVTETYSTTGLM